MIAVDTNVLVYANATDGPFRTQAIEQLRILAEGADPWAIPWPCIYEYLRVATHPTVVRTPVSARNAWDRLGPLLASPTMSFLAETPRHAEVLGGVLEQSGATGNLVYDAHIWALCLEHGVTELLSGDRDFARFRGLKLRSPFGGA